MKRIQRQRKKGWRMPPNTVYVGRPSRWGNPFPVRKDSALAVPQDLRWSLSMFEKWAKLTEQLDPGFLDPLRGKNLACWCPLDQPCHADVLLELVDCGTLKRKHPSGGEHPFRAELRSVS